MRIDNPISNNAIITGSFTGSFKGDGSQITGVTGEWDGSHVGDANITGSLTVGGHILPSAANTYDLGSETQYFRSAYISAGTIKLMNTGTGAVEKSLSAETVVTQDELAASLPAGVVSGSAQITISGTTGYSTLNDAVVANTAKISFDSLSSAKLAGIEANATEDQTGAEIKALYEAEADTNAFTDAASAKLAGIEANATGDQTGSEIKALYEAEANTNAFTDTEKTKLGNIEANATGDQSAAEIKTAYESNANTNVFDDAAVSKLAGLEAGAEVNVVTSVASKTGDVSLVKGDVGLGSVDNTSDANKPISTAAQTALNLKAPLASPTFTGTITIPTPVSTDNSSKAASTAYVNAKIQEVVATAPAALDTLNELAAAIGDDANFAGTVTTALGQKLVKASNLSDLTNASAARTNLGLGSAATTNSTAYATAAQGTKADSAHGWGDHSLVGYLTSYTDTNTTYSAGTGLGLSGTTFSHSDTSTQASVNNSGRTYIQDITLDGFGHVTGIASATETVVNTDTNTQLSDGDIAAFGYIKTYTDTNTTYSAGTGLGLSGTTFSHSDTSTQASVNNSGRTYIQDITLDGFGHVTGIASATETVVNTDTIITYSAGNGLSLSGTTFSMSGAFTGNFSATGNITAYSDSRLKKDVKTIEGALAKTKSLRGVEFTRISDDTKSIGVIAQELEAVLPELVLTDDEGMKSVNYAQITGLLIEAVKELSAKVDELSK